jgi:hypothetical protein
MAASAILGGPVAQAVRDATEVGVVVPSILRKNLQAAGFAIEEFELKHLKGIRVFSGKSKWPNPTNLTSTALGDDHGKVETASEFNGEELVAQGLSFDFADALLHALLGYVRERTYTATPDEAKAILAAEDIVGNEEKGIKPMLAPEHIEKIRLRIPG